MFFSTYFVLKIQHINRIIVLLQSVSRLEIFIIECHLQLPHNHAIFGVRTLRTGFFKKNHHAGFICTGIIIDYTLREKQLVKVRKKIALFNVVVN